MFAKIAFYSSCATAFAGTAYVVGLWMAPPPTFSVSNEHRINTFDDLANSYESKTKKQEFYLGIGRLRRNLLREHAQGRVLEVGAGTGSNVELYPADRCDEVVLCDRSPNMVHAAARKVRARLGYEPFVYPEYQIDEGLAAKLLHQTPDPSVPVVRAATAHPMTPPPPCRLHDGLPPITEALSLGRGGDIVLRERQSEIAARQAQRTSTDGGASSLSSPSIATALYAVACYPAEMLPFPDNSFDTVVDMFGLCSFDDPVRALQEMSRVCKPSGHLVLLEHGKGTWTTLNNYLDKWAPRHASMWGCWWNRDIRRYLRLSGIDVQERQGKHFGTTHCIIAKPYKSLAERKAEATASSVNRSQSA